MLLSSPYVTFHPLWHLCSKTLKLYLCSCSKNLERSDFRAYDFPILMSLVPTAIECICTEQNHAAMSRTTCRDCGDLLTQENRTMKSVSKKRKTILPEPLQDLYYGIRHSSSPFEEGASQTIFGNAMCPLWSHSGVALWSWPRARKILSWVDLHDM